MSPDYRRGTLQVTAETALLPGGATQAASWLDATCARRVGVGGRLGPPYLPATVLRGALREALRLAAPHLGDDEPCEPGAPCSPCLV